MSNMHSIKISENVNTISGSGCIDIVNARNVKRCFFRLFYTHFVGLGFFFQEAVHACDVDDPHNENRINGSSKWF